MASRQQGGAVWVESVLHVHEDDMFYMIYQMWCNLSTLMANNSYFVGEAGGDNCYVHVLIIIILDMKYRGCM